MNNIRSKLGALLVLAAGGTCAFVAMQQAHVEAADHLDPPHRTNPDPAFAGAAADRHADIADVYAWTRGTGTDRTLVTVLSFSGPNAPVAGQAVPCDADVEYSILISNTAEAGYPPTAAELAPEFTLTMRLGEDDQHHCFYQVVGAPGVPTGVALTGLAQHSVALGNVTTEVGLFDDAFFFDLTGFRMVAGGQGLIARDSAGVPMHDASGTGYVLNIQNDRDFFAGMNTPAWIVEIPLIAVSPTNQAIRIWATTARHS